MHARSTSLAGLLLAVALSAIPGPLAAEPYRRAPDMFVVPPGPEGIGCYWYRGREHCSRYCYWEVNGKRYCREREREAYSQVPAAPHAAVLPWQAPHAPMKLGVGAGVARADR